MLNSTQIQEHLTAARAARAAAEKTATTLQSTISRIDPRLKDDIREADIKKLKDTLIPAITSTVKTVTDIADQVRPSISPWNDTSLLLSMENLTATRPAVSDPFGRPVDGLLEATCRNALLTEYQLMTTKQLEAHAAIAAARGENGKLHLLSLVHATRSAEKEFQPLDLSKAELKEQKAAVSALAEIAALELETTNIWRSAMTGQPAKAIDRITAQRAMDAAGVTSGN